MPEFLMVRNWAEYQHYLDRDPPWIKLHRRILSDYEFSCLQDASKLHLILIFLLASQTNNKIPKNAEWIKKQIGVNSEVDLEALVNTRFLTTWEQDASKPLAKRKQNAPLEEERRVEKKRKKTAQRRGVKESLRSGEEEKSAGLKAEGVLDNSGTAESSEPDQEGAQPGDYEPARFQKVWDAWPKKEGYAKAKKVWNKLQLPEPTLFKIWNDLPAWRMYAGWSQYNGRYCPKLENWLEKQGWLDDPPRPKVIG